MSLEYFFAYILPHFVWLIRIASDEQLPGYVNALKSLIFFVVR